MDDSKHNEGVIQSGGTINVGGSFAVGPHATAHSQASNLNAASNERGWQEIAAKLDALTQAISQHAQSPEQRRELDSHTREIREELGRQQPDKSKLTVILERIASGAKSIAPIFELALKLKSVIAAFL